MNELTCFVKYSPVSKTAATTVCALWLLATAAATYFVYPTVHTLAFIWQLQLWVCCGLLFVYVPYTVVSAYCEGGLLIVTGDGITFPPALLGLGRRESLRWEELKLIDFNTTNKSIKLLTTDDRAYNISTQKIATGEAEQFLFAMEVWSPKVTWTQAAGDFKDDLQNSKLGLNSDFTHMWDSELKRRYSVTTFAPHPPQTKLQSGRLTILKQLAFGGFSAIYLAEDENRERVVVKELVMPASGGAGQKKAVEMFDRESKLLARIEHEHIARVIDHFIEADRHYLVLDYIDGQNLRELVLRKGPLDETIVINLAQAMLSMLEYLHNMNPPLIHRDFTPDNLIITAQGELTLVDFGAANECVSAATGTLVGKQSYMPIEQIRGKAEPRSDLYALGCTLYFLLTGLDPEPLSELTTTKVSPALAAILQRLTQFEPVDRFENTGEVNLALSQLKETLAKPSK